MGQTPLTFGAYLKELRLAAGYGLRRFAVEAGFQPSNLSNIARGKKPPPTDPDRQAQLADTLGLIEGSKERARFFDLAAAAVRAPLPADVARYAERSRAIPQMLRTAQSKDLTDEEFHKLTEYINKHF